MKKTSLSRGGCHCGRVRFEADLGEGPLRALSCNCSICSMTGFVHLIVPREQFRLVSGDDMLTSYRFGTGTAEHLFCSRCGVKSFYRPRSHPDAWSVNANSLDEKPDMVIEEFDGENWEASKAALDGGEASG